ncbi:MAG TPA: hypothetical protein VMT95_05425 [Candidatus Binatia bacterium]|nr:hypothetical protein [Candidatus Binatia bacterium]
MITRYAIPAGLFVLSAALPVASSAATIAQIRGSPSSYAPVIVAQNIPPSPAPRPTTQLLPAPATTSKIQAAEANLRHLSILKGDYFGAPTPIAGPIPLPNFFVFLSRAFCIPPATAVPVTSPWYTAAVLALNRVASVAAPQRVSQLPRTITREQAAVDTVRIATAKHAIQYGALPGRLPDFADESSIAPAAQDAAKMAVFLHLLSVGPDNRFNPQSPLITGDTYLLLNAVKVKTGNNPCT